MRKEKEMATHSRLLPGKFHGWRSLAGYSPGGHKELDTTEQLHFLYFYSSFWRKKWQPTPVFFPGESCGQRGLVGYSLWSCRESDTTRQLTHTQLWGMSAQHFSNALGSECDILRRYQYHIRLHCNPET